jgi:hypothetical protein
MAMKHLTERHRRRWGTNRALLVVLGGLAVLFYAITWVRFGGG